MTMQAKCLEVTRQVCSMCCSKFTVGNYARENEMESIVGYTHILNPVFCSHCPMIELEKMQKSVLKQSGGLKLSPHKENSQRIRDEKFIRILGQPIKVIDIRFRSTNVLLPNA